MIPAIYPSSTLKTDLRKVKDATQDALAIITDGNRGNYLFGSTQAFKDEIAEAAWEAANAERISAGIEQGMADIAHGAFVVGTDAAIALSEKMRLARG